MDLTEIGYGFNSSGLEQGLVASSCENSNEHADSIKDGKLLH
jgi:hypothetical protein